ncbi:uncharacterized protein PG998_013846 [Apiospora kogelbergensis]|uniref:uncharacterized protein n=1 Tax=Apiospora kogelbergensis TaxID=1337665 RepID=UPI00312FD009
MINKFKSSTPDNMLGARALMTDILGAFNRTVEWSLANNINAGPAYYMRHQLDCIYHAWKMAMDNHMPALTEDHKRGIEAMEAEETEMKYRHGDNNERFRLWQQLQQSYLTNPIPQWQHRMPTWQQPMPTWYYPVHTAATQHSQPTPLPQTSSTVAAAASPGKSSVSSGQGPLEKSPAPARHVKRKSKQHVMGSNVEFSEDNSLKPNEAKRQKQNDARESRAARRQDKSWNWRSNEFKTRS